MAKWLSPPPKQCDICRQPITGRFVDGATRMGPWAIMCEDCHREVGYTLGVGRGQMFDVKTLEKVQ
jgi:hypothetical protein